MSMRRVEPPARASTIRQSPNAAWSPARRSRGPGSPIVAPPSGGPPSAASRPAATVALVQSGDKASPRAYAMPTIGDSDGGRGLDAAEIERLLDDGGKRVVSAPDLTGPVTVLAS